MAVGKHEPGKADMWQTVYPLKPDSKWEYWSVSGTAGTAAGSCQPSSRLHCAADTCLFSPISLGEITTAFPEPCGKEAQK